jgi:tetratricopeptide (TPR) repeat protein
MSKKVTATILFVDIIDSMEIANYWDTRKYSDFLNEFRRVMLRGIGAHEKIIKSMQLKGDELVVFYASGDVRRDVALAVYLANMLKILWYTSRTNFERIREGKKILDLGIGINTGDVVSDYRPIIKGVRGPVGRREELEGFAISLAKRIESFSRQGRYSRIMVGHRTMAELNKLYHHYEYQFMGLQKFRGMSQGIPVFELKSCYSREAELLAELDFKLIMSQLEQIRMFDPGNVWLLMILIGIYSKKKNYKKVENLCREALTVDDSVANIHHELGVSLHEQKKYKEALNHFDTAITLQRDRWNSYIGKSVCFLNLGQWDKCIETCKYAIHNIPTWLKGSFCDDLYYYMAAAYARKENVKKAIANIKKAIRIGGAKILKKLKKDEGENFCNLYDNADFKQMRQGKTKVAGKKSRK